MAGESASLDRWPRTEQIEVRSPTRVPARLRTPGRGLPGGLAGRVFAAGWGLPEAWPGAPSHTASSLALTPTYGRRAKSELPVGSSPRSREQRLDPVSDVLRYGPPIVLASRRP